MQALINGASGLLRVALDFAFIWATKQVIDVATGTVNQPHTSMFGDLFTFTFSSLSSAGAVLIAIMALQLA